MTIVVPPHAVYNPLYGNQPCTSHDAYTVVYDEKYGLIHVLHEERGYVQQLTSNEALARFETVMEYVR